VLTVCVQLLELLGGCLSGGPAFAPKPLQLGGGLGVCSAGGRLSSRQPAPRVPQLPLQALGSRMV
jgi:hypothetical protein